MTLVRSQFERIQSQLIALTPSQKMLTASLLAIMVMTLFYWVHYAASPEYEPVIDQSLSAEESGQITSFLRDHGYDVQVNGDRVLVPADKQMQAVAELTYAQKMPQNITDGFDVIMKDMNPFDSADKTDVMWNHAKEITLAGIISRWPGVAGASVVIDTMMKRGLSLTDTIKPSASVNIRMRSGVKPDKQLAQASVKLLTGAVAALDPDKVSVIVDGMPVNAQQSGGLGAADSLLDLQRDQESYLANKIKTNLAYMNAPVFAEVSVDVDNQSVSKEQTVVDTKNSLYKPIKQQTSSDETDAAQSAPAEAGVGANIQASVAGASAPKSTSTKTQETDEYTLVPSQTTTRSVQTPGKITVLAATVQLPRTYFIACYKQENPSAKTPDASALQAIIDKQMPAIRGAIHGCTGLADDAINVGLYDPITVDTDVEAAVEAQPGTISLALSGHVKDIAVGA
ncbi:MAG TPA: flagellar M-ring protein FliF C-terminal domain-containing protein, partial [Tepidisphaeraceae bacterium]|nr:flagellar M-ring protein FliF C-terminal domain-containing protein [Tepidisphaeraceae bacterium]